jgi:hypothetical protein
VARSAGVVLVKIDSVEPTTPPFGHPSLSKEGSSRDSNMSVISQVPRWYKPRICEAFSADATFGSLSILSLPFSIHGAVQGKVWVSLRNREGLSSLLSFSLP